MAKTFYTEHEIEDMVKRGVQSLVLNDDVVLTELAFEKANRLGLKLVNAIDTPPAAPVRPYIASPAGQHSDNTSRQSSTPKTLDKENLKLRIKNGVVARLGSQVDPILLDTIIERVLNTVEKR